MTVRRRFISGLVTTGTAVIAGCLGDGGDETESRTDSFDTGSDETESVSEPTDGFTQEYEQPWRTRIFDPGERTSATDSAVAIVSELWKVFDSLSEEDELYQEVYERFDEPYVEDPTQMEYLLNHHPFEGDIGQSARVRVGAFDPETYLDSIAEQLPSAEREDPRNGFEILTHDERDSVWAANSEVIINSHDADRYLVNTFEGGERLSAVQSDFELAYNAIPREAFTMRFADLDESNISVGCGGNLLTADPGPEFDYIVAVFASEEAVDVEEMVELFFETGATTEEIEQEGGSVSVAGRVVRILFS